MEKEEILFTQIVESLSAKYEHVEAGKMMSSPGIKFRNKVFAFYYQDQMCFKLGKGFDIESLGIHDYSFLSPFKNKPPMKGWFNVPFAYQDQWKSLAEIALEKMQMELG